MSRRLHRISPKKRFFNYLKKKMSTQEVIPALSLEALINGANKNSRDNTIILSCTLNPDQTLQEEAKKRVDKGIELYDEWLCSMLTMSGGYAENSCRDVSHAEAMLRYAAAKGVPLDDILKEEKSLDTVGQAFFTKREILVPRNWADIIVVSSDYHLHRVKFIFGFILGDDFKVEYEGVDTGLLYDAKTSEEEFSKTRGFVETFKGVMPGNDEQIKEALFTRHPLYVGKEYLLE
jgi:hypothetical protein